MNTITPKEKLRTHVEPLTSAVVVGRSHQALKEYQAGILAEYVSYAPLSAQNLKKLADLKPKTLAIMLLRINSDRCQSDQAADALS